MNPQMNLLDPMNSSLKPLCIEKSNSIEASAAENQTKPSFPVAKMIVGIDVPQYFPIKGESADLPSKIARKSTLLVIIGTNLVTSFN